MNNLLSNRIKNIPKSFIREILKVTTQADVISFAGGLPNSGLFPVEEIERACCTVLKNNGPKALQYSSTEGDAGLREWIAQRYKSEQGLDVSPESILITNGSQQTFDLIGKVLLNESDNIAIENPGYLGAIQSFGLFQPTMHTIELNEDGLNLEELEQVLTTQKPKLLYCVPNFQNPTGISYSEENRKAVSEIVKKHDTLLVQDDPYGALRFSGSPKSSFYEFIPEQTLLLGTFSKIVVPSFRLGWIIAPEWIMGPLTIAKQAADLHTNYFSQQVMLQYLTDNSLDEHIAKITSFYSKQKKAMIKAIEKYLPEDVHVASSEGGMFLWLTLPEHISSMDLFDVSIKNKVAFVPGEPFYVDSVKQNTARLSFVTASLEEIDKGIRRLGQCITTMSKDA
ncbi:MAG: 2-aminoadipate transaminase [Cocleimonas sp.]|jgi:2-aminoadipate transaminase